MPLTTVKALALRELHKFPEFNGAVPTNPTPLHFPDGRLAAYEFRMVKNGKTLGYIIVSANRNLPPAILEAGFGEKTPSNLMKELAVKKGVKNHRFAYFSGLNYGILTRDKIIDMKGKEYRKPSRYTLALENKAEDNQKQWMTVETLTSTDKIDYIAPLATITSQKIIYGVPAWTSSDLGKEFNIPQLPDGDPWEYIGPAEDPWSDWDGCAPIATSMIVGYYEPQYTTDWYREAIIDELHVLMSTDYDGNTAPENIGPGLEGFYNRAMTDYLEGKFNDPPKYSYDVYRYQNPAPESLFWSLKYEVDNNRPGILRIQGAYLEESKWVNYPHATTFVGYKINSDGTKYIYLHTTWAYWLNGKPSTDWLLVGNWNTADLYLVTATCQDYACPLSIGGDVNER